MPHGWRLPARSGVSPRACATESTPPLAPAITSALADRTAIDWDALFDRVSGTRERAALQTLRQLDAARGRPCRGTRPPPRDLRTFALRLLVIVAAGQTAAGLASAAVAFAAGHTLGPLTMPMLAGAAFASSAVLLASAAARDQRVLLLLAAFTCAASAFARALFMALGGDPSAALFRGVCPEAFAPAALAQFAVHFPHVQRFTRVDVWARRSAAAAWALASVSFAANVITAYGPAAWPLARFARADPGNLFWYVFSAAAVPAMLGIFVRARRSSPEERRRVGRLGYALAAGMAPFVLTAAARLAVPGAERWLTSASGAARFGVDLAVVAALAAMPVLATIALIVDRPFDLPVVVAPPLRRWLTRARLRLADLARTGSLRRRRSRERLTAALARLHLASGSRALAAVLRRELLFGVAARFVTILEADELDADSALLAILDASPGPVVLSRESEPLVLLPKDEREWLQEREVGLASALRRRNGTTAAIVLLGTRRGGAAYDRIDRWFVSTLVTAAAAWDVAEQEHGDRDEALECARCGVVAKAEPLACGCGAAAVPARLPRVLAGKFEVARRIGSGGMGVVYLARDASLGRDVALKTLPAHGGGAVVRLRDEARAMAALNHPALATLYGVELWRGSPVLVVEYMAGGTLAARLTKGSMRLGEVIALGISIADALIYMHARGVLHRDVKPSNLGLTDDGAVKLLDFGLSGDEANPAGTPAYLPPEALAGAAPDAAVDLWGLAVVLREAGGARHAELEPFFRRALATTPGDRYPSAVALRDALVAVRDRGQGAGG